MSEINVAISDPIRWTPRPDPILTVLGLVSAALWWFAPDQAASSFAFVAKAALSVGPLFLLSIALLAGAAGAGADNLIARAFVGRSAPMVVLAALMGALSPFCSCGVIPLIAALLTIGVPLPAVMAFWLASPLMDPAQFVLTASVLGWPFALAKTVAAIMVGLIGGFGTLGLVRVGMLHDPLRNGVGDGGCGGSKIRRPKEVMWAFWHEPARLSKALNAARSNSLFLGKMLILAFVLESLMVAWMPPGLVARWLGGDGVWSILLSTIVGIPAYLNGTAALPLMRELMSQGMSPGAALAFLVGGGVTSIPAAIAVWSIARPPVFAAYLGFAVVGAALSGLVWQAASKLLVGV